MLIKPIISNNYELKLTNSRVIEQYELVLLLFTEFQIKKLGTQDSYE